MDRRLHPRELCRIKTEGCSRVEQILSIAKEKKYKDIQELAEDILGIVESSPSLSKMIQNKVAKKD